MTLPEHPDFGSFSLDKPRDPIEVDTSDAVRDASLALIAGARREIVLLSRHLDPRLYDNPQTAEALREFVLRSRRTRVRILVKNPARLARRGHQVLSLAQRLATFIEIRVPAPEYRAVNVAFLVADGIGAVYRPLSDRFEASVHFGDRHMAGELTREFDDMWETSRTDQELRRMVM